MRKKYNVYDVVESVRLRPGMYVGGLDEKGICYALSEWILFAFEVLEASVFQLVMIDGFQFKIEIRNIEYSLSPTYLFPWVGESFGNRFLFVLSSLSKHFRATFLKDNQVVRRDSFVEGYAVSSIFLGKENREYDAIQMFFSIDVRFFRNKPFKGGYIQEKIKESAFLFPGKLMDLEYDNQSFLFQYKNGLQDRFKELMEDHATHYEIPICFQFREGDFAYETLFVMMDSKDVFYSSYCNNDSTVYGGEHVELLCESILVVYEMMLGGKKERNKYELSKSRLKRHLSFLVHIHLNPPVYKGSTRHCVGWFYQKEMVMEYLVEFLSKDFLIQEKMKDWLLFFQK